MSQSDSLIIEHYRKEAVARGLDPSSTMHDEMIRTREVEVVLSCLAYVMTQVQKATLLDVGCGNGYLLSVLRQRFPALELVGADCSPDMVQLAQGRDLDRCEVRRCDARELTLADASVDIVISERCVVNILDEEDQYRAFADIARVIKPGGFLICIEAFTDGFENANRARAELGLPPTEVPYHNLWLDPDTFQRRLETQFEILSAEELEKLRLPPRNFLSSHYFISRVLYPAVTRAEIAYNTDFVRFFSFLPPQGNFAPVQLRLCRKRSPVP